MSRFSYRPTAPQIASWIELFLAGKGGPWDWDDFISTRIRYDAELDAIRLQCSGVREEFPPRPGIGEYCSPQGMSVLRAIAEELRQRDPAASELDPD